MTAAPVSLRANEQSSCEGKILRCRLKPEGVASVKEPRLYGGVRRAGNSRPIRVNGAPGLPAPAFAAQMNSSHKRSISENNI